MVEHTPLHELKIGSVRAWIWERESPSGLKHEVTVARVYREGDRWQTSDRFGLDDLPLVAEIMDMAHLWLYEQAELIA